MELSWVAGTARNERGVSRRQWRRWNEDERIVFNEVYGVMVGQQGVVGHPGMGTVPEEWWATICHNAAWVAAEAVRGLRG